ncbi:MAG: phenylalanine--tRNA ligase subunit alpha [Candidatus Aenigmatarchaeota archaeon]|nr:MAG: phenylalanine--tRNA ligase subunit alpha [Candidatus Aenigmarchaeota archaeon]
MYQLTKEGEKYLKEGLPEERLAKLVEKSPLSLEECSKHVDNLSIALAWGKKKGLIKLEGSNVVFIKHDDGEELRKLRKIKDGKEIDKNSANRLLRRKLIAEIKEDIDKQAERQLIYITQKRTEGVEIKSKSRIDESDTPITPQLIKTGLWKEIDLKSREIKKPRKINFVSGRKHIITEYIELFRKIFLSLGFTEITGPLVESSFWNFDALYQPQDHPAREMADTFFLENPSKAKLPDKKIVERVKAMHEHGNGESTGWGYKWSSEIARQLVLRTHTTAVSARQLAKTRGAGKFFCIGRVFRNETIDFKHLPEFTQIDGIVIEKDVGFKDLLGYLKEFYRRLGFEKVRFRPAYFPYTEMSVEPEVYLKERKEWVELGGAGIFRPEVTIPLGVKYPVLAWGLGLERPIMLKFGIKDIKRFYYTNDLKFLKEVEID